MSDVLVLVETAATGIRKPSLELLTAARAIGDPVAVLCGAPADAVDTLVAELGEYGATAVYVAASDAFDSYLSVPKVDVLADLAARVQPLAVLLTSGPEGKDIAARLAVRLDSGLITDAISIDAPDGVVTCVQSVVSATWRARSQVVRGTAVVTMPPNATSAEASPATPKVEQVDVTLGEASRAAAVTGREPKGTTGRPDLAEAAVVVAGGRGVGSADGFSVLERLADALGGAVGATRAATDLEWVSHDLQIGQTGKTVAPSLYVAAGVSGAIQHRAGMQSSKTIIAINKDPKAPIFGIADFGVVGDLHQILPVLSDEIARKTT